MELKKKNGRPVLPVSSIDPEEIDKIEKDLLNKCHFIEPFFLPRIEKYQIDDKYIVVLWVTAGQGRPYMASELPQPKGCQLPGFVENCFQHY